MFLFFFFFVLADDVKLDPSITRNGRARMTFGGRDERGKISDQIHGLVAKRVARAKVISDALPSISHKSLSKRAQYFGISVLRKRAKKKNATENRL